jgi:hypothetical protein
MRTDRIASLYDDPGRFASVLVDLSRDSEDGQHRVELQVRAARERLAGQGAPDQVLGAVEERLTEDLREPAPVSRFLVVTERGVLFDDMVRTRTEEPLATWDALPDLTQWIAIQDGYIPFVLAFVDHTGGQVAAYRTDALNADEHEVVRGETDHVHKFGGGGWAHLRYQHVTENVWRQNAQAVVDQVRSHVSAGFRLVLLAGDPKSRGQARQLLGDSGPAEVMHLDVAGGTLEADDDSLDKAVQEALRQAAIERRLDVVRTFQERRGRGEAVATGIPDVTDAFVRGQVDTLLIDPERVAEHTLDPRDHRGLALGAITANQAIRADLVLVAAAALTAADVTTARQATLGKEPVAALLRWDQPADGTS